MRNDCEVQPVCRHWRATKKVTRHGVPSGPSATEEVLVGYYDGERGMIQEFLAEAGHQEVVLAPVRFVPITGVSLPALKEARARARDAQEELDRMVRL